MRLLRISALGAIMFALACSDPTSASIASSVSGSWEIPEMIPGSRFAMTLANHGSLLSGSGVVLMEAGPGAYSTIQGEVDGHIVNLDFTLVPNGNQSGTGTISRHFTGRLVQDQLRGTMTFSQSPDAVPTTFVRMVLTPL